MSQSEKEREITREKEKGREIMLPNRVNWVGNSNKPSVSLWQSINILTRYIATGLIRFRAYVSENDASKQNKND